MSRTKGASRKMPNNLGSSVLKTGPCVRKPSSWCFSKTPRGFPDSLWRMWSHTHRNERWWRQGGQSDTHVVKRRTWVHWGWANLKHHPRAAWCNGAWLTRHWHQCVSSCPSERRRQVVPRLLSLNRRPAWVPKSSPNSEKQKPSVRGKSKPGVLQQVICKDYVYVTLVTLTCDVPFSPEPVH